jgi:hypothetical protein
VLFSILLLDHNITDLSQFVILPFDQSIAECLLQVIVLCFHHTITFDVPLMLFCVHHIITLCFPVIALFSHHRMLDSWPVMVFSVFHVLVRIKLFVFIFTEPLPTWLRIAEFVDQVEIIFTFSIK